MGRMLYLKLNLHADTRNYKKYIRDTSIFENIEDPNKTATLNFFLILICMHSQNMREMITEKHARKYSGGTKYQMRGGYGNIRRAESIVTGYCVTHKRN